jgi:multidrug efflux pump subunit AcrA (membrane-fusion protein)
MKRISMKRMLLPALGVVAALWATYSIARTTPRRTATDPPAPPPVSEYADRVAAVGLVEASSENVSIGTPLAGVVARVFVTAGQPVRAGDPLFELDLRQLQADLEVRRRALAAAAARVAVSSARLDDLARQLSFVERVRVNNPRAISAEELSRRRSAVQTATAELGGARAEVASAGAQVRAAETEIERSTIRAPLDADVLQVKIRAGEFAPAGPTDPPLVLLGRVRPLHVRVDVDEQEAWRVRQGAPATGHVRGNAHVATPLAFVRFEPYVTPKRSLTGDNTERVDTRVLQVIYRVERADVPLYVGQQLDVFIEGQARDREPPSLARGRPGS